MIYVPSQGDKIRLLQPYTYLNVDEPYIVTSVSPLTIRRVDDEFRWHVSVHDVELWVNGLTADEAVSELCETWRRRFDPLAGDVYRRVDELIYRLEREVR